MSVAVSEELFATSNVAGETLFDAMKDAARARGFLPVDEGQAREGVGVSCLLPLSPASGKAGARVRADLGLHAQPIAAAAARALGVPVTLVAASGVATGARGRLTVSLAVRAVQLGRDGRARALRAEAEGGEYEQEDDLDWRDEGELLRVGYDHAGQLLGAAARGLGLSLDDEGPRVVHLLRRPTGTPRVEELVSLIALSRGHDLAKQPDGRVLVRIILDDGKRLAYVSAAEAEELAKLLAR